MACFQGYIGIDYSGRGKPTAGNPTIRVYEAGVGTEALAVHSAVARNWSRAEAAAWLLSRLRENERAIVGVDHAFSFPRIKLKGYASWPRFLRVFRSKWQTDRKSVSKAAISSAYPGCERLLRLTEQWTSSAKGVFDCNGPGVACSTFAGLPWLLHIREQCRGRVFFWPFDGWEPPGDKHVIAEVYPSLFRNRYRHSGLKGDCLDAFSVAQWLKDMDANGFLARYFNPPLTAEQKDVARLEGWILGVA